MTRVIYWIGCIFVSLFAATATAAPAVLSDPGTQARLDSSFQYEFKSGISGKEYAVRVFVPEGVPLPSKGYPVLYVLDGDALFGPFAMAMAVRGAVGEITPAVVVGISGTDGPNGAHRTFDYSATSLTAEEQGIIKDFGPGANLGGAAQFFRVLTDEIRPRIDATFKIDETRSSLLGWSLGAHFTLYALLEHPEAFKNFIALSPSLWLGGRYLFNDIPDFQARIAAGSGRPNLLLGVGSLESRLDTNGFAGRISAADFAREIAYTRMVSNVDDFAQRLQATFHQSGMTLVNHLYEGDTHNSEPFSAVNSVLDFAYGKKL